MTAAAFGICGRMGAGKSTLAGILSREGLCRVIEVDDLRRNALWASRSDRHVAMREKLSARLEVPLSNPGAGLCRQTLSRRVFGIPGGLAAFRDVAAPVLVEDAQAAIGEGAGPVAVVWAMLVEDGFASLLQGPIVVMTCPGPVAVRRVVSQGAAMVDSLSPDEAAKRVGAQPGDGLRLAEARAVSAEVIVLDAERGLSPRDLDIVRGRIAAMRGNAP